MTIGSVRFFFSLSSASPTLEAPRVPPPVRTEEDSGTEDSGAIGFDFFLSTTTTTTTTVLLRARPKRVVAAAAVDRSINRSTATTRGGRCGVREDGKGERVVERKKERKKKNRGSSESTSNLATDRPRRNTNNQKRANL
mmetsp:Transcript_18982/g.44071  ORF Transcript_18982/g.44071 Transcript_18982/m.44071 type:complete len:139 (-) Transcript_18982:54-470(-)